MFVMGNWITQWFHVFTQWLENNFQGPVFTRAAPPLLLLTTQTTTV